MKFHQAVSKKTKKCSTEKSEFLQIKYANYAKWVDEIQCGLGKAEKFFVFKKPLVGILRIMLSDITR